MHRCIPAAISLFVLSPALMPGAAHAAPSGQARPAAADAAAALNRLFKDSAEASLRRNPLEALSRGDLRYAAEFGDYLTPAYFAAEEGAVRDDLARLGAIDRAALDPTGQLAYDVFKWQGEQTLESLSPEILALTAVRPMDHKTGLQTYFPATSSGRGAAPYKTVADYENGLSRLDGFITYLDRARDRFREGMRSGVVQPKLVIDMVVDQFDTLIAEGVEESTFYLPVKSFPDSIGAADRERLAAAYRKALADKLMPAMTRYRNFLVEEYRPAARDSVGLSQMKDGERLYRHLIAQRTTLPLDPDEVHRLGLGEVDRIRGRMEEIKAKVGFQGTLLEFFEHIRTDPKFKPASKEALTEGYYAIAKRVDAGLGALFSTFPKTPLKIEPVPAYREKAASGASYLSGAPDGSRPGTFVFNTYDLPSRTTTGMESLYMHEGVPGHHFESALAQENEALPDFLRFGGGTPFSEGWALYAESLGPEIGMYGDPYQLFGHLNYEMFRAIRLVVDTGIHAKGWSSTRAVDYILANSALSRTEAESEVKRYIAWPGQALSYKIGQLKIRALRTRAEKALGGRFDIREFHQQVLGTGALPLAILERKIDAWIASKA